MRDESKNEGVAPSSRNPSWEIIGDHPHGPLVAVRFVGTYPPGSSGNDFADAMVEFLRSALKETDAAGVVLDLTGLEYEWGDAICGLVRPLQRKDSLRPAAIVATGETARALEPLLGPTFLLGLAGVKLARSREEALGQIVQRLNETSMTPGEPALGQIVQRLNETSMTPGEPESVSPISCRVVADREGDSRWWSFYLINDEDSPLGSAVLDKVCYEWGDQYLETKKPNERVKNLAPGDQARIWRDDGESETRIDLWLTIKHRGQKKRFVFGFPKLYKQTGNHLDGLGSGA